MAEAANGWPFLVARGRYRGYRTVLAPDFLAQRKLQGVLSDTATGDGLEPGRARVAELDAPAIGPMTLWFRTEQVQAADLNGHSPGNDGLATDEHGRPLEILYGVVARGRLSGPVHDGDLQTARSQALRSYRRFLEHEDRFGVDASPAFALRGVTTLPTRPGAKPTPPAPPPPTRAHRPALGALAAVAVAAAILVIVAWWVFLKSSAVDVNIAAAKARCGVTNRVTLTGSIVADKATTVTYHWELANGPSANFKVKVAKKNPERVAFDATSAAQRAPQGPFALVLDAPQSRQREIQACVPGSGAIGSTSSGDVSTVSAAGGSTGGRSGVR